MKLFMLILMTTQMVVDVEYKSNEEEQDSEKSVDYPSDDYITEWNEFQNIVTETKFRAFCQKFTERGQTSSQVSYLEFIACKEEPKTAIGVGVFS